MHKQQSLKIQLPIPPSSPEDEQELLSTLHYDNRTISPKCVMRRLSTKLKIVKKIIMIILILVLITTTDSIDYQLAVSTVRTKKFVVASKKKGGHCHSV